MPKAGQAGAVIYAKDATRLASFYSAVLQMKQVHADADVVVLDSQDMQLVIHVIPAHIADTFEITSPPQPREETAIKLFFTVPGIEWATDVAARHGGSVNREVWQGPGFSACNAVDPEGNIFQIRENAAG